MDSGVIPFSELQQICKPNGRRPRASTVRRWADRQNISYKADGSGGIWTTMDALNAALGLRTTESPDAPMEELI